MNERVRRGICPNLGPNLFQDTVTEKGEEGRGRDKDGKGSYFYRKKGNFEFIHFRGMEGRGKERKEDRRIGNCYFK